MVQDFAVLLLPATDILWDVELRRFLRMVFHAGFCGGDTLLLFPPAADILES